METVATTAPEGMSETDASDLFARVGVSGSRAAEAEDATAALSDLIAEDAGWRKLNAAFSQPDLLPQARATLLRTAVYMNQSSPLAVHAIDTLVAHIMGAAVQFKAADEDVHARLEEFWDHPDNRLNEDAPKLCREFFGLGELFLPIFVAANSGLVRIGYLHPLDVKEVQTADENPRQFTNVVQYGRNGNDDVVWRVANHMDAQEILQNSGERYMLYFPLQRQAWGRGRPILESAYYWIHHIQQFLADRVMLNKFLKAWVWDVSIEGTKADVQERAADIIANGLPVGGVNVHTSAETLEAKVPSINAADVKDDLVALIKYAGHAISFPGHWLGAEDDVNRSTADSASSPTTRTLQGWQQQFMQGVVFRILELQRDLFLAAGTIGSSVALEADRAGKGRDLSITIESPDITPDDNKAMADASSAITDALLKALQGKLTTVELARIVWHNVTGVEMPDDIEQQIAADRTQDAAGVYDKAPDPRQMAAAMQMLGNSNSNGNGRQDMPMRGVKVNP